MPVPDSLTQRAAQPRYEGRAANLGAITGSQAYPARPNTPFVLVHWPNRRGSWEAVTLDEITVWLPTFQQIHLEPGANGVLTPEPGKTALQGASPLLQRLRNEGAVVLDGPADIADYLCEIDAEAGGRRGKYFYPRWSILTEPLPGNVAKPKTDRRAYAEWRVRLVQSGRVPQPHPEVIKLTLREHQDAIDRIMARADMAPAVQERIVAQRTDALDAVAEAVMPQDIDAARRQVEADQAAAIAAVELRAKVRAELEAEIRAEANAQAEAKDADAKDKKKGRASPPAPAPESDVRNVADGGNG